MHGPVNFQLLTYDQYHFDRTKDLLHAKTESGLIAKIFWFIWSMDEGNFL